MSEENLEQHTDQIDTPDTESEARAQGWVAKEEFRGAESDWVDADTFVRRGREIMPILRKNNEKLLKELAIAKAAAEEARTAAKEFREFQKEQFERKTKDLELQLDQLKQAKREAISSGDGDRAQAIDDAMDTVKEERIAAKQSLQEAERKAIAPPQVTQDPDINEWMSKNEWFGTDRKMTAITNGLGTELRAENPNMTGKQFLEKLDQELATLYPEKFGKKRVQNPMGGQPSSSSRPTTGSGKQAYANLPPEAKAACDRFVKQGLMTKEQYVADYDWN